MSSLMKLIGIYYSMLTLWIPINHMHGQYQRMHSFCTNETTGAQVPMNLDNKLISNQLIDRGPEIEMKQMNTKRHQI